MFIALELGIMTGSYSTISTYDNTMKSIPAVFLVGVVFSSLAFSYLFWHLNRRKSLT
jgi:hypothetical protein